MSSGTGHPGLRGDELAGLNVGRYSPVHVVPGRLRLIWDDCHHEAARRLIDAGVARVTSNKDWGDWGDSEDQFIVFLPSALEHPGLLEQMWALDPGP